jgi:hypothetical protein
MPASITDVRVGPVVIPAVYVRIAGLVLTLLVIALLLNFVVG